MAKLVQLPGGGPINDAERLVVATLLRELPDGYSVVPNIEVSNLGGQRLEYDVVVAAPHAVYVVETKAFLGDVAGDDRTWLVDGSARAAPIQLTSRKARVLKGHLSERLPPLRNAWVEPAVVLAVPPKSMALSPDAQRRTFDPNRLVAFLQQPSQLPHGQRRMDRLVDQVVGVLQGSTTARTGPRAFNQWQVIETLQTNGEETEYRAVNKMAPNVPPVRLRVVSLSPYAASPAELDERRRRLAREYVAHQRMGTHPNITAARDVFDDDHGDVVVVTDEITGPTLGILLANRVTMTDADRLEYLRQLATAVQHAHRHGVIHRRLTPDVVIVRDRIKLGGFGYARVEAEGTITWSVSEEVDVRYLAPEVLDRRYGPVSDATDLYGLGAIAGALWIGGPPAAGAEAPAAMPSALQPVVSTLIAAKPTERTATLGDLLDAINRSAEQAGTSTSPLRVEPEPVAVRAPARYEPGDYIDSRYEVREMLGWGAFSTVYLVHDQWSSTDFALKMFAPNFGLEVVQRELKALMKIHHPHVVRVVDASRTTTSPPQCYLKSEYVDGTTLADVTEGGHQLPLDQVLRIASEFLDALCSFHPDDGRIAELEGRSEMTAEEFDELQRLRSEGIVHRDIKPQNIIRRPNGGITLVDFNIATPVGSPVMTSSCTPEYQPPDADLTTWDTSTDIFATGVVLFQLLTGRHPYQDSRPMAGVAPTPALEIVPDVPAAVAAVIDRACAPERATRFASATEMRRALDAASTTLTVKDSTTAGETTPATATPPADVPGGSAPDEVRQRFGLEVSGRLARFRAPGWFYVGQTPTDCPDCGIVLEGFRKAYQTNRGQYFYWALACLKCRCLWAPEDLSEDARKALYQASKHRPTH